MATISMTNPPLMKDQIEFLLGEKIKLLEREIASLFHLTIGNEWVLIVLDRVGKTIVDIKYKEDREVLKKEWGKDKKYKHLFN